jgi:hypothetical protein
LRLVLLWVIDRQWTVTERHSKYRLLSKIPPADRPPGNEPFSRAFSSSLVIAVGAGGILTSFTSGLSLP